LKGDYDNKPACGARKNKANSKPILGQVKSKKAKGKMKVYPEFIRRRDLKKQSQFDGGVNWRKILFERRL